MKFIVDAQLPKTLAELLREKGYYAIHTLELPAQNRTPDRQITELAQTEHLVVLTKDSDFLNSHLVSGKPEKLVLVKTGNTQPPFAGFIR